MIEERTRKGRGKDEERTRKGRGKDEGGEYKEKMRRVTRRGRGDEYDGEGTRS